MLIDLRKEGRTAAVQFYGCGLRCAYCMHRMQERKEHSVEQVMEFLLDPKVEEVYLGGGEPILQKEELMDLLARIKRMGKRVTLKTNGGDPDLLSRALPFVSRIVLEIKCPLDDVECYAKLTGMDRGCTVRYLAALRQTLEVLRGKEVRIWVRAIPHYTTVDRMGRIGKQMHGVAGEATLVQFLSKPENDVPFEGISSPSPSEGEMVLMARKLLEFVPRVEVLGKDFRLEFCSPKRTA